MSDTFCPIPWIFQAVRANGDIRVCCQANVTKNQGVIRKESGEAFNAGRDSLEESRNSSMMKSIRINMLNGTWSEECGRCKKEEENGLNSRRIYENQQWSFSIDEARQHTAEDGSIKNIPVSYYDLRFGNFCNLKCRMCGPTDSSAWYDDWIKLTGTNKFRDTSGEVTIFENEKGYFSTEFDWPNYEPFWDQLENNAHNIQHVYFAGGEPMLIERHYEFLEKCVELDVAKNIIIEYNTNATTLPTRVLNLWKSFKQVRIGASVDGMNGMQEYHRYPAKWEKILKNLYKIDNLPDNVFSWLAFTVTAYNVNHMIDFMKWKLKESNFRKINSTIRRPIVTHHVAHHPKHLNVRVLPDQYKHHVSKRFDEFVEWIKNNNFEAHVIKQAEDIANGIKNYMNGESYYENHWKEFLDYTKKLDEIRNEKLLTTEPSFEKYING